LTSCAQACTTEAGSGTCSSISMQVTTSNARSLGGQGFDRDLAIGEFLDTGFERMQLRHLERLVGEVDAQHLRRTPARHGFGEDATAASHVENLLATHPAGAEQALDPVQAQGIDLV
jgi:hypothetical protein